MSRYAIGDIHGGAKTFRALLEKLNLKHDDQLYLIGDYVDRGNDSKGVLDIILQLMEAGYNVLPIRGNHDDMMLRSCTGDHDDFSDMWMEGWGQEALKSFAVAHPVDVPFCYVTLIENMPYIRHDDKFVFVHAGLDMETDDPINDSHHETMIWGQSTDCTSTKLGGRKLVTGHMIHTLPEIMSSLKSDHILLDNGAFTNRRPDQGNLIALNLDTMSIIFQPWLDGETLP